MDVAIVHWPIEADRLERLRVERIPRLVMVARGSPPVTTDDLEDWLRTPADEIEIRIRIATLRGRASRNRAALSIEDGVLRAGDRLVVLSPIQARLAAALINRMNTVVGRDTLARHAWPDGAPADRNSLDVHIAKLRRMVAGTDIEICTVYRRGYLLRVVSAGEVVTGMS